MSRLVGRRTVRSYHNSSTTVPFYRFGGVLPVTGRHDRPPGWKTGAVEFAEHVMGFRSGFTSVVGRPNARKSTLINAMVGEKVASTSSRPQTTRHAIRGIVHQPLGQLILVDTPGLHRPRTLLGERLNDLVRATWAEVDVVALCIPADEPIGPGDQFIARELAALGRTPTVAVITKTDLVDRDQLAAQLLAVDRMGTELGLDWAEIVPVSAVTAEQTELLTELLLARLPEGSSE